uniref:uncharacterized protein LOC105350849 n=1 Tax=Fragaria vesca subsp. vesca TaxID=101020 RepID=UPI0005C8EA05|nr:PREDICTED: uncharacterized protein LOC105350849 [Fragaria vesca subsp. vesca]
MPFGFKNAGATYQRLVNAMFEEEIGEVMEVYVDDMLVKNKTNDGHIANLDKVFTKLLTHGMRLNPQKCIMAVGGGKFLGFMVSERGIEANPEKIHAILDMTVLSTRNEVQCLTGRLVALARFISRLTDKCNPFFQLLKSQYKENVTWGSEHDNAFNNIKAYLAAVPLLSKPIPREVLYLYLAVSATAISAALTCYEHDNELPVYYCGRGFADPETLYPDIEKLALALITAVRKLRQYFQAHTIHVLTNHPLRQILQKPETSGRMNKREAQRLRHKASLYLLRGGKLYRWGQSCPFLKCLPTEEGYKVLKSLHNGVCENHAGARNLMFKALRAGYYSPTLEQDAKATIQACLQCHKFANFAHHPPVPLSVIISPVIFSQWELDFVGLLPTTPEQFKFAIIIVDYNTKWIEAEPLATITTEKVINFLRRNLYCRFGVPQAIITDNGTQFDNDTFKEFLSKQGITIFYASPTHPQTNGQVEAINKLIKQNLRKRLEDAKGLWAAKLPEVLWTLRTTPTIATCESLYLLSYGTEAVIPIEMEVLSERVTAYDPETNATGLRLNMDLLEERRDRAHLRNVNNKQKIAQHYNKKVVPSPLKVGDWVMKEVIPHPTGLKAKWESPLEIVNVPGPATFYLRDTDGRVLPHPWNARHLHLYPI